MSKISQIAISSVVLALLITAGLFQVRCISVASELAQEVSPTPYLFDAPFLTDADMKIYFNDLYGRVYSDGNPVIFYHKDIVSVLCNDEEARIVTVGKDWLQVEMPTGEHDIKIVIDPQASAHKDVYDPETFGVNNGILVNSIATLRTALAVAKPGDEIVLKNGVYVGNVTITANGEEGKPITIRPQIPGKVIFAGAGTHLTINGSYLTIKGFRFEHAYDTRGYNTAVAFNGTAQHNRLTQNHFFNCGSPGHFNGNVVSLRFGASYNRLDHNFFTLAHSMAIAQHEGSPVDQVGVYNKIDRNVFRNISNMWYVNGTGQATLQFAQGELGYSNYMRATVEYNLFDNNVQGQCVSFKSCGNLARRNVFASSRATFWFRSGFDNIADGNVFYNVNGAMAVATGERHSIINNLFVNPQQYGITFWHNLSARHELRDVLIANNTFVNCNIDSQMGEAQYVPRRTGNRIINNLFISDTGRHGVNANLQTTTHQPVIENNLTVRTEGGEITRADQVGANIGVERDMPILPQVRGDVIEPYIGIAIVEQEDEQRGNVVVSNSAPHNFVMEWHINQGKLGESAALNFSGGYSLEWEGVDFATQKGTYIVFKKNGVEITRTINVELDNRDPASDPQGYSARNAPDPNKWHRYRLLNKSGYIILQQYLPRGGYSPLLAWEDTGVLGGDVLRGATINFQTVGLKVKEVKVWQCK